MDQKACRRCRKWLSLDRFSKDRTKKDGLRGICKDCTATGMQQWRIANRDALLKKKREYYYENRASILALRKVAKNGARYLARLKQEVYNHYGNKCYCCGLDDPRFLTVEHLSNDGHASRYPGGKRKSGTAMYREIIDADFPDDIALACYNCNCARSHAGRGGICPHQQPWSSAQDKLTYFIDEADARVVGGHYDLPTWLPDDVRSDEDEKAKAAAPPPERRSLRRKVKTQQPKLF